jgi:hypothetical protein
MQATYFQTRNHIAPMNIRQIVAWSRTDRKGLPVLAPQPTGGCMRWGLCETQPEAGADVATDAPAEV